MIREEGNDGWALGSIFPRLGCLIMEMGQSRLGNYAAGFNTNRALGVAARLHLSDADEYGRV